MVGQTLGHCWLVVVQRLSTIRNVRLAVALANEQFANKSLTVVQQLDAHNPPQIRS